jgi:SAM-dependent methyltransferase
MNRSPDPARCTCCGSSDVRLRWAEKLPRTITSTEFSYAADRSYHGRILGCRACGHGFVDPLPVGDPESVYSAVEDESYVRSEAQRRRTFGEFLDMKETFVAERGSLLDVGCYIGLCMEEARKRGYSVEGTELSRWAAGVARSRGLTVHGVAAASVGTLDRCYDTIVAFDVLEHLADPLQALVALRGRLRDGGCLFATVPDMGMWHARLLGERHWLVMLMHFQYFNRRSLGRLLERAGFSRVSLATAPPYRVEIDEALKIAEYNPLVRLPLSLAGTVLQRLRVREISLTASLFVAAWK